MAAMMPPPGAPVAMLVLMDTDLDRQSVCRHLRNLHGLTDAEQAIAIADGQTVSEIAESSGVSRHTLRNQLKSVYANTGLNGQAQLAALVNRLAF
ncbi:helix-turn-helix transcriptional regulator [Sedimentitalea sp. HM32M-2]|uniref:helix-turn-helix transcriptional regulator n=1 Tax=Sedimentitalea sp. HM32M-2 TaxID=3351566 RepID=UPI00362A4C92